MCVCVCCKYGEDAINNKKLKKIVQLEKKKRGPKKNVKKNWNGEDAIADRIVLEKVQQRNEIFFYVDLNCYVSIRFNGEECAKKNT